ncbi:MAG: hypothetical protein JNM89_02255 [Hyphomicrobiaceae bacterium]|nr:hypothetical protein [Hyphomicrobiaceae bacterium]
MSALAQSTGVSISTTLAAALTGIALGVALLIAAASPAAACPHGYKPVVIQGNSVCRLDIGGPTSLKAPGGGGTEPATRRAFRQ